MAAWPGPDGANGSARRGGGGALKRLIGTWTTVFIGLGVAIGSGIFTTPGDIAATIPAPGWILAAWVAGGVITYLQALVTAELATRFPAAGAEYQFLRAAYGDFAAFFFGWSFTIFIIGAGAGVIAAGLGRIAAEWSGLGGRGVESLFGCAALAAVTAANVAGLRAGAALQNVLTVLKAAAVLGIAAAAIIGAGRWTPAAVDAAVGAAGSGAVDAGGAATMTWTGLLLGLVGVMWAYSGATDSAKMAEEIRDVRRRLPRALATTTIALTVLYVVYQYGLLCAAPPQTLRGSGNAAVTALTAGEFGRYRGVVHAVGIIVCLGSISATILSNVRVTFALARDGLAPRALGRMNAGQSPAWSQALAALLAAAFVAQRSFTEILGIYFVASSILYGMAYMSLLVFRARDRRAGFRREDIYRVPGGGWTAALVTATQLLIAVTVARDELARGGHDWLYTLVVLGAIAAAYPVWRGKWRMANSE